MVQVLSYTTTSNLLILGYLILTEACEQSLLPAVNVSSGPSQFPCHPTALRKTQISLLLLYFAFFFHFAVSLPQMKWKAVLAEWH